MLLQLIEIYSSIIVTGDEEGDVRFYDKQIRFLYCLHAIKFDPIKTISFHLKKRRYKFEDPFTFSGGLLTVNNCECLLTRCFHFIFIFRK